MTDMATYQPLTPGTTYVGEQRWKHSPLGPGVARTRLEILGDDIDDGPYGVLQLGWLGDQEPGEHPQPCIWGIEWKHYIGYLGSNCILVDYLNRYSPASDQVLGTLLASLPPKLRKYFRRR
jgi:hypothetical protein